MNKIRAIFCFVLMAVLSAGAIAQSERITIAGTNVNVRESAGTTAKVKFQLTMHDECILLEQGKKETIGEKTDHWYKVRYNDSEGWVFGAFTSRALGNFIPEGTYNNCWGDMETGDFGCPLQLEINKNNGLYSGEITQGYPNATDGYTFPKQTLRKLIVNESNGAISFVFTACTNITYSSDNKENRTMEEVVATGTVTCKAITLTILAGSGYKEEYVCLIKTK